MAEPVKQKDPVYDDDSAGKPVTRPNLRAREGLNTNTTGGQSGSDSTPAGARAGGAGSSTTGRSGGTGSTTTGSAGGATSGTGGGRSSYQTPQSLKRGEESGGRSVEREDDRVGQGYTPGNSDSTTKSKVRFRITKKRAAIAGVGTSTIVGMIFGFSSIATGPLEFVHIAQLLDKFHFSSQQDAEDGRLMKIARYIKDPDKPQNTRMGLVGNAVANRLEAKVNEATGLSSDYDSSSGRFKGYVVDRTNENFQGKSDEQIKAQLASQYGIDESAINITGGEISFNPDTGGFNTVKSYLSQTHTARTILGEAGYSKVEAYVGTRILSTRAGWTFHPIQALDSTIQAKAIEAGAKAYEKFKEQAQQQFNKDEVKYVTTGVEPVDVNASNDSPKDKDGNPTDPNATSVADSANGVNAEVGQTAADLNNGTDSTGQLSDDLSAKAKAGGAAGIVGLLCILEGLGSQIQQAKFDKAELPMMRMAGNAISTGSQVQSGQDITPLQLGFDANQLETKNSSGQVTSTWNQAQSIQAEEGQPQTGPDIPKAGQVFGSSNPFEDILSNIPGLSPICSALASPLDLIISVITGPVSAVVGLATGPIINDASSTAAGWLAGAPVNPLSSGADYGNYINYGARLSANEQYGSAGGVQMNSGSEQELADTENNLDQSEFQSKSIAYRLFNTSDDQTLASKLIDNYGSSSGVQDVASMTRNFGSIFSVALRIPATLLSGVTHAAASQTYNWHGLQKVGFTAEELSDKRFENPFDNACHVAGDCKLSNGRLVQTGQGILSGSNGSMYISRVQQCFGVKISGDATTGWTVDSSQPVNFDDASYPSSACEDSGQDWLRIRFWLLDTQTLEGYDCYDGTSSTSDQSCTDVGFQSTASTGTAPSAGSSDTLPTGSAQDLAKQLLPFISSGKITCGSAAGGTGPANCLDIQNTANGTPIGGNCAVPALTPHLLGLILGLVQTDGWTLGISAICSNHSPEGDGPYAGHSYGSSADFSIQNGATGLAAANDEKFVNDAAALLASTGGSFGQVATSGGVDTDTNCHVAYASEKASNFTLFPDTCNHQHIRAAP